MLRTSIRIFINLRASDFGIGAPSFSARSLRALAGGSIELHLGDSGDGYDRISNLPFTVPEYADVEDADASCAVNEARPWYTT